MYRIFTETIVCVVKKTARTFTTLLLVASGDECMREHVATKQSLVGENIDYFALFLIL